MATCFLCPEDEISDAHLLAHLRLNHPEHLPDFWPDGGIVFFEDVD